LHWGRRRHLLASITTLVLAYQRTSSLVIRARPTGARLGPIWEPFRSTTRVPLFWPGITPTDESICPPSVSALPALSWAGPLTRGSPGRVQRSYRFRAQRIGAGQR